MIDVRVLGPIDVLRNGQPIPLGGPRQRVLLALLTVDAPRPVPLDRLVDELWGGAPPDGAHATLRAYLSKLRTALAPDASITSTVAGYALELGAHDVDAIRFEQLANEGHEAIARGAARVAATRLRLALELWRGEPYAGISDDGALRIEAQRLEAIRLTAVEDRIDADLALGEDAGLVEELRGLVRDHPYRERIWGQLMLALYRAGRQTEALATYRRAHAMFAEDLGLEPSDALQRLERAILRHEVAAVRSLDERDRLPAAVSTFVGREMDLDALDALSAGTRLLTLTGVGGVGKTRLAIEWARRGLGDASDGAYFVDLSALTDPLLVPRRVATALDMHEESDVPIIEQLVTRLRDTEPLIVLDNCEHLRQASAELCARLLESCPRLRVLATSREALGVPGEVDYPVPPLPVPAVESDRALWRDSGAVQLFLARAREAQGRSSEGPDSLEIAARICRDLDGLPLAIELAAARSKAFSFAEIASRLDDRFQFLVSWRRLSPARHQTLRAAMDWSYELLTPDERRLLERLTAFAAGFTLDAAVAIAPDELTASAVDILGRLVEASLVVGPERDDRARYRLLETVRQYAAERLEWSGEAAAVRRRHATYFAALAEAIETRGAGQSRGLAQLDAEIDNMRAASAWAVGTGDSDTELRLVAALWPYWHVRGHLAEGRDRLEAAITRDGAAASGTYTRAVFGAGILAWSIGDYRRVRALTKDLLAAADSTGSLRDRHAANKLLSHVTLRERKFAAAERYSKRTLALARKLGVDHDVSTAQLNLAVVYLDWGKTQAAMPMLEDVLAYNRRHGIEEGAGFALLNLGEADYHLGNDSQALMRFEEARKAFVSVGFRAHVGHALTGLAGVRMSRGDHEEAARLLGRADAVLAEVGASKDDFDPTLADTVAAAARAHLGDDAFAAAYEDGRRSPDLD